MEVTYQLGRVNEITGTTGFGSAKRVKEYKYHPDDIKKLKTGEGIFLSKDTMTSSKVHFNKPF